MDDRRFTGYLPDRADYQDSIEEPSSGQHASGHEVELEKDKTIRCTGKCAVSLGVISVAVVTVGQEVRLCNINLKYHTFICEMPKFIQ